MRAVYHRLGPMIRLHIVRDLLFCGGLRSTVLRSPEAAAIVAPVALLFSFVFSYGWKFITNMRSEQDLFFFFSIWIYFSLKMCQTGTLCFSRCNSPRTGKTGWIISLICPAFSNCATAFSRAMVIGLQPRGKQPCMTTSRTAAVSLSSMSS